MLVGEQKIRMEAHDRDDFDAGGFGVLRCHTAGTGSEAWTMYENAKV